MAFAARSTDSTPMSGINITPMVGVLLALMVVFAMMGSPANSTRLPIQIPQASCGIGMPFPTLLEVSIKNNGEVFLGGRYHTDGQLAFAMRSAAGNATLESPLQVVIRADPTTRFDRFTDVLAMARRSGIDTPAISAVDVD